MADGQENVSEALERLQEGGSRPQGETGGSGSNGTTLQSRASWAGRLGLTTLVLNAFNSGFVDKSSEGLVWPLGIFFGGLAQFAAGMWEAKKNNTFGFTAFSSFGAFWMFLGLTKILVSTKAIGPVAAGRFVTVPGGLGDLHRLHDRGHSQDIGRVTVRVRHADHSVLPAGDRRPQRNLGEDRRLGRDNLRRHSALRVLRHRHERDLGTTGSAAGRRKEVSRDLPPGRPHLVIQQYRRAASLLLKGARSPPSSCFPFRDARLARRRALT